MKLTEKLTTDEAIELLVEILALLQQQLGDKMHTQDFLDRVQKQKNK